MVQQLPFRLPKVRGDAVNFHGVGRKFTVKRIVGRDYCLFTAGSDRVRFGNKDEITADILYCLEAGKLPPRSTGSFA